MGVTIACQAIFRRAITLLAGIRAGETTSIAFPSMCSKRSVAEMEAELKALWRCLQIRSLTVAGAAQVGRLGA